jgi:hypothetical protein
MDDPLLSSLCSICHIDPPKYTCPRCAAQTCSLKCSKRHKLWSSCDGIRDPTVFIPKSKLATPSGIDHDYNFLHSIETRVERSEKRIVEDLGLVEKAELQRARADVDEDEWRRSHKGRHAPGEECIMRVLKFMGIRVIKAPKGMRRNTENTTNWLRKQKSVNWQVEWIREGNRRDLYHAAGHMPVGDFYTAMCEEERRMNMTDEEKRTEKKRKSQETKVRLAKKARLERQKELDLTARPSLQNPETGAWNLNPMVLALEGDTKQESPEWKPKTYNFRLCLLRPLTPASFPKVLVPIDPAKPLTELLRKRDVLEFPTIYVFEKDGNDLPEEFMLEKVYLTVTGQAAPAESDTEMSDTSEGKDGEDDTSSSDSSDEDSEEDVEDGEIMEVSKPKSLGNLPEDIIKPRPRSRLIEEIV